MSKTTGNRGGYAARIGTLLEAAFADTRRFRADRADRFPDDDRNAKAIEIFDKLIGSLGSCELSDLCSVGDSNAFDVVDQPNEKLREALKEVGFQSFPTDASEFVQSFIN